jgi:hypothetical protein
VVMVGVYRRVWAKARPGSDAMFWIPPSGSAWVLSCNRLFPLKGHPQAC